MRARSMAVILAVATLGGALTASAQATPLEEARAAYRDGALDEAATLFDAALEAGGHDASALADIHLHLGILAAIVGDIDAARASFDRALSLDPSLSAPQELNPELQAIFTAVQESREVGAVELSLRVPERVDPLSDTPVTVGIGAAPDGLAAGVQLLVDGSVDVVHSASLEDGASVTLRLPASAWRGRRALDLTVRALDLHGSTVATAERHLVATVTPAPVAATAPQPADEDEEDGGGVLASPWFWIVGAVLVLGGAAAAVAVVLATSEQDPPVVGRPMVTGLSW